MASLFNREPGRRPPPGPYDRERIAKEIDHLKNRESVRHAPGTKSRNVRAPWLVILLVAGFLWLYFMDPVLHAFHRGEAVRTYLYLRHNGSDKKARELLATGLFTPREIDLLDRRPGTFQNYYSGPGEASRAADGIIGYLHGVTDLQNGSYDKLDMVGKIRYELFVRFGIHPPASWDLLNPSIND